MHTYRLLLTYILCTAKCRPLIDNFTFFFTLDVNECADGTHTCHSNATCTNTDGSYSCACKVGFSGNGSNCTGTLTRANMQTFSFYVVDFSFAHDSSSRELNAI